MAGPLRSCANPGNEPYEVDGVPTDLMQNCEMSQSVNVVNTWVGRLSPCRLPRSRQCPVQVRCCADQREMRKRLGEISKMPAIGTKFF